MPTRPTEAQIRAIITTQRTPEQVESFIDSTMVLIEDLLDGSGYSDSRKREIYRWVTAHLIASTAEEGVLSSDSYGGASHGYARAQLKMFLQGTTYGQQALMFDEDDLLNGLGVPRATIEVL